MKKVVLCIAIAAIMYACGGSDGKKSSFPQYEYCQADSVAINEILAPREADVFMNEFYVVFLSPKTAKVFYRYSIPDFTFMDTTFTRGEGPEDVGYPYMWKNNLPGSDFWFFDGNKREIKKCSIGPEEIAVSKVIGKDEMVNRASPFRSTVVNDKYVVYDPISWTESRSHIVVASLSDSMRVLDSIPTLAFVEVKELGGGRAAISTNTPNVAIYGSRMMCVYPMLGTSIRYDIKNDGSIEYVTTYGKEYTYDDVKNIDWKTRNQSAEFSTQVKACTADYIFMCKRKYERVEEIAPETGESEQVIKWTGVSIEVYDWEMNPVKEIELNKKEANTVLVDVYRNKVYAWDSKKDFEKVYIYDFKLDAPSAE